MSQSQEAITKAFLRDRQVAYRRLFAGDGDASALVLADLGKFCREKETTFHLDQRIHAALEGRREVILRIQDYLRLTVDELYEKYGKGKQHG